MCRLLFYLGQESIFLSDILMAPQHSILEMSVRGANHIPHLSRDEKTSGRNHSINLDGFGVAWYLPHDARRRSHDPSERSLSLTRKW
jgi:predicted glutamine amidotransferase